MTPATEDILRSYAAGATTPGVALLVATQMAQAAEARASVERFERMGGALFAVSPGAEMSEGALSAVLDRLDDDGGAQVDPPCFDAGPLPSAVMTAVGQDFNRIPWRFRLPGVSEYRVPGFGSESVSLLRARPGASIPQHTHEGQEITLVMTGAMQDGARVFGAGEVSINDEDDDHKPRIVGTEICHCLIVMSGALRFTGRFGRALNLLAE